VSSPLQESSLRSVPRVHRGKVRDIYALGDAHLLILTTDRLSAFDVILPRPIPGKGAVLTAVTEFWMKRFAGIIPNHLAPEVRLAHYLKPDELAQCAGRVAVARKLKALPVEAVVRGYLIGSGWKDYRSTGAVCGIALPRGLQLAALLPEPVFTPATKAAAGEHDENISYAEVERLIGAPLAAQVKQISLQLYSFAAEHARRRGIIIADTKFEFGLDERGRLVLSDEVLTPDSSRFWPADTYEVGKSPPSFDKQFVRDYLETLDWDKRAPGPALPPQIVAKTSEKYLEALARLTGPPTP
jgi:phosphoribosylaminoimidazole-succinocarboxamide synthase